MKHTLVEKIFARNVGHEVKPGDIITVNVDWCMVDDIMAKFCIHKFEEMGFTKVFDPDKICLIYDHFVPATQTDDTIAFHAGDAFAEKYGLTHVHRTDGICHQLMTEAGYVKPGDIAFGTDSHTVTYGCVGAFSTGIGYTEMASILGTGQVWVRVPESIKVVVDGVLPENVTSKDVILRIIGDLTASGATYQSIEFTGTTIDAMSVASRMTMSNMAVECGAKNGIFIPDEKTCEYCGIPYDDSIKELRPDEGATYSRVLHYQAEELVPVMACPSLVDNIHPVSEIKGVKVDEVFLGSCTNGRLEDLHMVANMLKGKKKAPFVQFIVTPASREVYKAAMDDGTMEILSNAGAIITTPGCGLCCGRAGGVLTDGEVVISTSNRNFLGRMGTSKVQIYLASPIMAAKAVIAGEITDEEV
ncbi:MAG: 3-isopropylmalate dehydratase large subunit [Lachnospiraceae bacterium]|nr:3-isopropylmalate dehydratase large subunit [Lachnospiraceae bacterium]